MIETVRDYVLPAAFSLLPKPMESASAVRILIAIGWQESRFVHRRQISGPARGFWQFEHKGGLVGVMSHAKTADHFHRTLKTLGYPANYEPAPCFYALEHNDIWAAVCARLLLWTDPSPLPETAEAGWRLYLRTWRPGKPHPETWPEAWERAA